MKIDAELKKVDSVREGLELIEIAYTPTRLHRLNSSPAVGKIDFRYFRSSLKVLRGIIMKA